MSVKVFSQVQSWMKSRLDKVRVIFFLFRGVREATLKRQKVLVGAQDVTSLVKKINISDLARFTLIHLTLSGKNFNYYYNGYYNVKLDNKPWITNETKVISP